MPKSKEELKEYQRRQDYWRRRRAVDKLRREGSYLLTERMTVNQLYRKLGEELHSLLMELGDGANPTQYVAIMHAWDCYSAIVERGVQMTLI